MDDAGAAVIAAAEECLNVALLPRPTDCLACYLHRAVARRGCDGELTWTHEWQGHQRRMRRRTGGLTAYLKSRGGYCDCEVLMNVYPDREPDDNPQSGRCSHPAWR